jgi:dihydrofolate reductase
MGELTVDLFSTLDGFAGGGPNAEPYWGHGTPGLLAHIEEQLAVDHVMLMGATTYRLMAEIVASGSDQTFPRMAELPKIVFSTTLEEPLSWANTTLVREPVATAVPALKARDDLPIRTIGSRALSRSLFGLGLVDRVQVLMFPIVGGASGDEPIFEGWPGTELELVGSRVVDGRHVLVVYRVAR